MMLKGLHEKDIFTGRYPFRLAPNTEVDFSYPLHWHSAVELIYVLENGYCVNLNGQDWPLQEKDIVFVAAGDIHGFDLKNNKGKRFFLQFDISRLEAFQDLNAVKPFLASSRKITPSDDPVLHHSMEEQILGILEASEKKDFFYDLFVNARVLDILVLLARNFSGKAACQEAAVSRSHVAGLDKLNLALQYLEENFQQGITLEDVSKAAGFSQYHFSRLFKEVMEKNFHDYLNELRIKKAEKLLAEVNTSITQAAYAAGFNSAATFNRLFKKIKGHSPSTYRKMRV